MNIVLKTVLYSYTALDGIVEGLDELVLYKAVSSFQSSSKTLAQMDKILLLQNQADRLTGLKVLVEDILSRLSDEERRLAEYKFFRKKSGDDFDYSSRKYFRKQKKLEAKLDKIAEKRGINEEWFKREFSDVYFLRVKYSKLKAIAEKSTTQNSVRDRNA